MKRLWFALLLIATPAAAQQMLSGSGVPAASTGKEGDFFYDYSTSRVWGPKTSGAWGSPSVATDLGSTTGTAPGAGLVGEQIESSIAVGSAVAATTATSIDITTVTITPGNWLCAGNVATNPAG